MIERDWFKHDYGSSSDLKIIALRAKFGMRGYGIFWALVESMYDNAGKIELSQPHVEPSLAFMLGDKDFIEVVHYCVELGLFIRLENGDVSSDRVVDSLNKRAEKVAKASEAGKRSFNKRSTVVEQTLDDCSTEKRREEESRLEKKEKIREARARALPPQIPGYEIARANPEALQRFEKAFPNSEMRRHYLDSLEEWLPEQKKSVQERCSIRRLLTWIRRDKFEKRGWFSVRSGQSPPPQPKPPPINQDGAKLLKSLNVNGLTKEMK